MFSLSVPSRVETGSSAAIIIPRESYVSCLPQQRLLYEITDQKNSLQGVGATTGRNIRNLPCVSRKNNNLHGVCMFAIDCVKSNGTHLGTCIDRFYFGSCCLVPPVPDIIENTIESDIIPHREPPLRISNTTSTSPVSSTTPSVTTASTANPEPVTTEKVLVNSTDKVEEKTQSSISSDYKLTETSTVGSSTTEATTTPQKLQTFQVVHGSTTNEVTIKPPSTTPKPSIATENPTKSSTTTPKPTKSSTTTPKPTKASTTTKPIKISTTTSKPATPKPVTKPKPLKVSTTTSKPIKTTRPAPTKPTSKPTKPVRVTSTKKPVSTQASTTTPKPTATTTTPTSTTTAVPTSTTQKIEDVTLKHHLVLTTTVSNEIPLTKINVSQILETVNGNPATNEIEATKPVAPLVTPGPETKPGLVTWTVADPKNHTEAPTTEAVNVTEEEDGSSRRAVKP
ncbi:hypothetical protein NQ315_007109 [Exocentrus adspersus]|uniref:Serine proteinase stubble n=1 Tax=Exocentrus adspersus TaxID=1586481 RepID=A0AAV8WCN6_9CUCU|nr:hypothetical protein NQ315_007109 [Exocentrus adspersus]